MIMGVKASLANPCGGRIPAVELRNVFLHVTKQCNLRCRYCYFSAAEPLSDEMTGAECARLWPDVVAVRPRKVVFTGGEPLLRQDILELMRGLKDADPEHHVLRCLNTNGQFVTHALARELVGLADEVRVSLDALSQRNDALRGKGNFDKAVRALETFYSVGFEPKVLVTVTSHSLPDLEELLVFLVGKKLTRINVNIFRPVGRGARHPEFLPVLQSVREACRRAWQRYAGDGGEFPEPEVPNAQCNCGVGKFLNIMPNGDVFPCHVLTQREFRLGNVREQGLLEICRKEGRLGELAELDFHDLANQDGNVGQFTRPGMCMGDVYARTSDRAVWSKNLSLNQSP